MASDLVSRLRQVDCRHRGRKLEDYADALCREAADTIERYEAALREIVRHGQCSAVIQHPTLWIIARDALRSQDKGEG